MVRYILLLLVAVLPILNIDAADRVIIVSVSSGDMTIKLQDAVSRAAKYAGKPVTIKLVNDNYNISREDASRHVYYISNTASASENPDPTKHIGIWIKDMKNLTIDGDGAMLVTHGEMTSIVIDNSENITIKNLSVNASDPTVPEMCVIDVSQNGFIAKVHHLSDYKINNNELEWVGKGWSFKGGIAQCFNPSTNLSLRCGSLLSGASVTELGKDTLSFSYDRPMKFRVGDIYQMRDGIRDQVASFIHRSENVVFENVKFNFLGNFGIVGQYSENITMDGIRCEPEYGSGRTCAGFADFIQISGCKGNITIKNSRFEGAHDDPINIHGTNLSVVEYLADNKLKARFMHPQSYGFDAFFSKDRIEIVDANSLLPIHSAVVKSAERLSDYDILLTLEKEVPEEVRNVKQTVVENVTYTPEVEISNNYFSRIPTRGILLSTRRKTIISDNVFYRMPMSAILIANDARSWFESGRVEDVVIKGNKFIECGSPVILISPENRVNNGYVHRNISITNNRFILNNNSAVYAKSTNGLVVEGNLFITESPDSEDKFVVTNECDNVSVTNNRITTR